MSGLCRFGLARAELKGPGNSPKNQITRVSAGRCSIVPDDGEIEDDLDDSDYYDAIGGEHAPY